MLELVRSPNNHRICLGNWSFDQLVSLSYTLLPTDTAEEIDVGLTLLVDNSTPGEVVSRKCVSRPRRRPICPQQTLPFFTSVSASISLTNFGRFLIRWFTAYVLVMLRESISLERKAQIQTARVKNNLKRFKTRKQAEKFVKKIVPLGQPPLLSPTATLFTNGFASKAG